ncbi:MAG: asparagine synthase (glutamine-hydrolyzing) [Bryobacteraceae bacterium]|nr:asparagine synthase (glutamine-hydrolyzing) [Bryobacteraceae bacterium]
MCGIAGIFSGRLSPDALNRALEAMNAAQRHRGPDQGGTFVCPAQGAGLACRRLSIVDLEHGDQPMPNEDGSIQAVLNGEIYNHAALRHELEGKGHRFRSRCDTEVIVHLYEEEGERLFDRLEGMFALAVLDTRNGTLLLGRDGPGMKPLYWAQTKHGLLFASEAKAMFATGLIAPEPDPAAIDAYLAAGYVPAPLSIFRGTRKLHAGNYLVARAGGVREGVFWRLRYSRDPAPTDDRDYADRLEVRLSAAVRSHLAADVPVGSFLSGGWDSSLVATFAAQQAGNRLKTFSIVFPEYAQADESRFSRLVARELGTDHQEIEYRTQDMPALLPSVARSVEEPCSTSPSGVEYQLASLAARHVKTVLSGDGADELFGGYEWVRLESPYLIRKVTPRWPFRRAAVLGFPVKLRRALRLLAAADGRLADAEWRRPCAPEEKRHLLKPEYCAGGPDVAPVLIPEETLRSCSDSLQRRLAIDFTARQAEGTLLVTDKVSMAHSLEVRMPFLDRGVVDFAMRLPSRLKVHRGREKRVLAILAQRHLPREIAVRRKRGLGYPNRSWSREPLASFVRQLLLDSNGPLNRRYVERNLPAWTGMRGDRRKLLASMFLQLWWNEFIANRPPVSG